jgi:primosomal protein N' (replication factor Y)
LGSGERIGVVIEHPRRSDVDSDKLKPALQCLDPEPVLDGELLETLRWCADYYHHPVGEVLSQALPGLLRRGRDTVAQAERLWELTSAGSAQQPDAVRARAPRQAEALDCLATTGASSERQLRVLKISAEVLRRLQQKGWIESRVRGSEPAEPGPPAASETLPALTEDQIRVLESVTTAPPGYHAFLLYGVTGSGKTEVYMRLIAEQFAAGRQTLLLVPEIGLTPQLVRRLTRRFGDHLAVMHSGLPAGQRLGAWRAARGGTVKLIVGTRSAVFCPLPDPGLIIVDEEHDPSFKQQEGFRYSARDLAVLRARRLNVPVLLASATPSLESYFNGRRGRYELLHMPERIGTAGQPDIRVIDLNRHASRHGLSTPLITSIERHLSENRQILLFLNRRGFAPVLLCPECGTVEECERCDARMTIHSASGRLRCHHCGTEKSLSWACGDCGAERVAVGAGTQRITEELRALFPDARVARLDRDATTRRGALASLLTDVERGDTQILVGTQMLTKGHDFPRVTLVGVLSADQGLFGTDFRSNERLAQTILQVAGRAGRRERPGEVLIQSHYPDHPLLACLLQQDYAAFAELALAERREARWPPFSHLVLWRAEARERTPGRNFLERVAAAARTRTAVVRVLGPAPAAMERRGGRYRCQLLFQCERRRPLHDLMRDLLPTVRAWPESRRLRWGVDVDPAEV